MPKDLPTLEIRAKLADLGLDSFVLVAAFWEGEHVRLVLTPNDSKRLTNELVSQVSASLRKIGCRCVLDDVKSGVKVKSRPIECFNRYVPLKSRIVMSCPRCMDSVGIRILWLRSS